MNQINYLHQSKPHNITLQMPNPLHKRQTIMRSKNGMILALMCKQSGTEREKNLHFGDLKVLDKGTGYFVSTEWLTNILGSIKKHGVSKTNNIQDSAYLVLHLGLKLFLLSRCHGSGSSSAGQQPGGLWQSCAGLGRRVFLGGDDEGDY